MKRDNSNTTSFIDLLFLCLFGVTFLFFLAFLLITPPIDDQRKKPKAEFLITLTWNGQTNDDVDLWVQNPAGDVMFFRQMNIGLMHLDHDDIGWTRDTIVSGGQRIIKYVNQEIATIRGIIPGEWIINIHMYAKRYGSAATINVRVDKLNPRFTTIVDKDYVMMSRGEEITVTRMVMTGKGEIESINDMFSPVVKQKLVAEEIR